jgi:hypothetical protein
MIQNDFPQKLFRYTFFNFNDIWFNIYVLTNDQHLFTETYMSIHPVYKLTHK